MKNQEPADTSDYQKAQFAHLIMMFATSALQHMGRIPDPQSGQAHLDLDGAQATIDMLDMLEAKTKGNLDAEETRMVTETLTSLKLNFVEVQRAGPAATPPRPEQKGQPAPPAQPAPSKTEPVIESKGPPSPDDDEKKKYHKSYG